MASPNMFALLDDDADADAGPVAQPTAVTKKAAAPKPADKKPAAARPNSAGGQRAPARNREFGEDPSDARGGGRTGGGPRGPRGGTGGRPPKREFERHSGTGRGKEVAKGGAGQHNWGQEGAEVADDGAADRTADAEEGDGENATDKPQREKEMSFQDYQKAQEALREGLTKPSARKATDKEDKSLQAYRKDEVEENAFAELATAAHKGSKKKKENKGKGVQTKDFFQEPRPQQRRGQEGRPQEAGPRGPRGGGGGGGRQAMPSTSDMSAFPALGAA